MVRMWVTESCNALCTHCMNASVRSQANMPIYKFEALCDYFKLNGFDKIGIMGGEPTLHPDFLTILTKAQECFEAVFLYTNALKADELYYYTPREHDIIIYNFSFSKSLTPEKLLLEKSGERILDVVVNHDSDIDYLNNEIKRVTSYNRQKIQVQLVLNNSVNIFRQKEQIIRNINQLYVKVKECAAINISFQCGAPLCFTYGESLPPFTNNTICPDEAILIDGDCNARFCNIHADKIINMFQGTKLIPYKILRNYIRKASLQNKMACMEKICKDCFFYGTKCNGKCHISQHCIGREDIIANTKIPWLNSLS